MVKTTMKENYWPIASQRREAANTEKGEEAAIPQTASSVPTYTWTTEDMARAYVFRTEKEMIETAVDVAFDQSEPELSLKTARLLDFFTEPCQPSNAGATSSSARTPEAIEDASPSAWVPAPTVALFPAPPGPAPPSLPNSPSVSKQVPADDRTGESKAYGFYLEEAQSKPATCTMLPWVEVLNMNLHANLSKIYSYYSGRHGQAGSHSQADILHYCEQYAYMSSYESNLPALQCRRGTGNIYSGMSERIAQSVICTAYLRSEAEHEAKLLKTGGSSWSYLGPKKYLASRLKRQPCSAAAAAAAAAASTTLTTLTTLQNHRTLVRELKTVMWGRRRYLSDTEITNETSARAAWMLSPTFMHKYGITLFSPVADASTSLVRLGTRS